MTGNLRTILVLVLLAAAAWAQDKEDPDRIKMGPRPGAKPEEKEDEGKKDEEPKEVDPFQAALEKLDTWPSLEALDAASTLALEGPEAEKPLIAALKTAKPARAAGIAEVRDVGLRFLNPVRDGAAAARAVEVVDRGDDRLVRVEVRDTGNDRTAVIAHVVGRAS